MIVARVVNDKGHAFNVRLVRRGDHFNDCLVHDKDDPLVEFWDATYADESFERELGRLVIGGEGG